MPPPPSHTHKVPRSSWEVLDAGPGPALGKEELGRVRSRLRGSGCVVGSGFRSPSHPSLTLNPSIPGSPTAPAGPLPSALHPTPPHPTLGPGRRENPGWSRSRSLRREAPAQPSPPAALLPWMVPVPSLLPGPFSFWPFPAPPQTEQVRGAPEFILPQDNTSFHSLYPTDPGGSPQKP